MTLPTLYYKDGYKYWVAKNYAIEVPFAPPDDIISEYIHYLRRPDGKGLLLIKEGYPWDGASGPTFDTKNTMIGSLGHDAMYELMRLELLPLSFRDDADAWLEALCNEATPGWRKPLEWLRFKGWFLAVRGFAGAQALKENDRPILTAP